VFIGGFRPRYSIETGLGGTRLVGLIVRVKVLFFGQLKDIVRSGEVQFQASEPASVASIFDHYASQFPSLAALRSSIVFARNQRFSAPSEPVEDGDEIAFLPPVSGGADPWTHVFSDDRGCFYALTRSPIDVRELVCRMQEGSDGAVVTFEGVVRNNTKGRPTLYLDYECYEAMAIRIMVDLGRDIVSTHAISRLAMVHRLGRMEIGEASVVIVAAAPHRKPAFDAALDGINRLKKTVPIWKKEYFADGEVWVEGEWDEQLRSRS
jgi:molybdopterin synthase catalytic subunit